MKKLMKIVSYAMVLYPLAATIWQTMPEEVTSLIPQYTDYIALVTGATSFTIGGGALVYLSNIDKVKSDSFAVFNGLYASYEEVKISNSALLAKQENIANKQIEIEQRQERIELLLEAELQAKLSNPFVEDTAKEKIQELLGVEDEV